MATLRDIHPVFPELLRAAELEGLVAVKKHAQYDLWIGNYTPKAQYDREWNDVTRACRGLIWGPDGRIVARPFAKFFNWDESTVPAIPSGTSLVSQKFDGSLGILYRTPYDEYKIATRGSFSSEQAGVGTLIFERIVSEMGGFQPEPEKTYLFEIIYPENRIVVDYGGQERLVLLDVIDNLTGRSDIAAFDRADWVDVAPKRALPTFHHSLVEEIGNNEEGFVLYWPHQDLRVKMKGPEYVRLHRIITNVSARTIWEYLSTGEPLDRLLESVPDEFYQWVKTTAADLQERFDNLDEALRVRFAKEMASIGWERFDREARKQFALQVKGLPYSGAFFRMWDDRSHDDIIWKAIRPEHSRPFWSGEE